jgi:hypothetical protein
MLDPTEPDARSRLEDTVSRRGDAALDENLGKTDDWDWRPFCCVVARTAEGA